MRKQQTIIDNIKQEKKEELLENRQHKQKLKPILYMTVLGIPFH